MSENRKNSMIDVARVAGVSVATVSHVINKTRYVSDDVKKRVNDAISELNYTPNNIARGLKTGKSNQILFIVPDIDNRFFTAIIEQLEEVISQAGYQLIIANTHETWEREKKHLVSYMQNRFAGLILATTQPDWSKLSEYIPNDIPTLLIDRKVNGSDLPFVWISAYKATYDCIKSLVEKGHKKIGYIKGSGVLSTTIERLQAYEDVIDCYNLEGVIAEGNSLRNSSPKCFNELIEKGCTAVFVSNGIMTDDIVYYRLIHPEYNKIEIAGFLESPMDNQMTSAAVLQPSDELGRVAGNKIIEMVSETDVTHCSVELQASYKLDHCISR